MNLFKQNKMKQFFRCSLITICIFFILTGCSKDHDSVDNYFRGKVDGVAFECNTNIKVNKPQPVSAQVNDPMIRINGGWPGYIIELDLGENGSNISPGTYFFEAGKNHSATFGIGTYPGIQTYFAGSYYCFGCNYQLPLSGNGRITILEISSQYVKGAFEFITEPTAGTNIIKTFTEGQFNIKRG